MLVNILKSKIHRARVVDANINYIGSITIDENLMEASGLLEFEKVHIVDVTNGARLETYVIKGERGSGMICLNGAAAHLVNINDLIIIMAYTWIDAQEAKEFNPKVVFPNADNKLI